ncbi:YodL domain-containing protein [Heyndrickxia acidicola]
MQFMQLIKHIKKEYNIYDATLFQTPAYGGKRGFEKVYRLDVPAKNHMEALNELFVLFNHPDSMPKDCKARFVSTGDIIFIDEGRKGHFYYQLKSGGWKSINRILLH